jgi:hypothetical protein
VLFWKARFLNKAGRLKLVNSVLSSMLTYFLTVINLKKWAIKKLDKIRRSFLLKGSENANGGRHCLVQWAKVQRPKQLGGPRGTGFRTFWKSLALEMAVVSMD